MSMTAHEICVETKRSSIKADVSNGTVTRSIERRWNVIGASASTQLQDIVDSGVVPALLSNHPSVTGAVLTSYDGAPLVDSASWQLTGSYSISSSIDSSSGNPWDWAPYNVRGGATPYQKYLGRAYKDGDSQGNPKVPIVNSAGDLFQTSPPITVYRPWTSFSYNLKDFDPSWVKKYSGTLNVNPTTVLGVSAEAKGARLLDIGYAYISAVDTPYWQIDMKIEFDDDQFLERIMDCGFYFIQAGKRYEIYHNAKGIFGDIDFLRSLSGYKKNDPAWEPVAATEPQALTSASSNKGGIKFPSGSFSADGLEYLPFQLNYAASWASLDIPKSLTGSGASYAGF